MRARRNEAPAVLYLGGHERVPVHLEITRYPGWMYVGRIAGRTLCWIGISVGTLVITFDPFVASFPFVIGMGATWRALKGRYHVHAFQGRCPRCAGDLVIRPGSKINLPFSMVCYRCHHEPELRLVAGPRQRAA